MNTPHFSKDTSLREIRKPFSELTRSTVEYVRTQAAGICQTIDMMGNGNTTPEKEVRATFRKKLVDLLNIEETMKRG